MNISVRGIRTQLLRSLPLAVAAVLGGAASAAVAASPLANSGSPLEVTHWGWTGPNGAVGGPGQRPTFDEAAGGPLDLWLDLAGNAQALSAIQDNGSVIVEVHWTHENGPAPAAPDLVTRLSVGSSAVLDRLEGEVRRRGAFLWHSWARKDTLSPGRWTVSLTYSDGRPVACGAAGVPCRLTVDIG